MKRDPHNAHAQWLAAAAVGGPMTPQEIRHFICPDRGLGEDALPYPPAHATGVPGCLNSGVPQQGTAGRSKARQSELVTFPVRLKWRPAENSNNNTSNATIRDKHQIELVVSL
jgi:hypothetical protein